MSARKREPEQPHVYRFAIQIFIVALAKDFVSLQDKINIIALN